MLSITIVIIMKSLSSDQRTDDDHHFSKKESHEKIIALLYYMDYKKQTLIETRINIVDIYWTNVILNINSYIKYLIVL